MSEQQDSKKMKIKSPTSGTNSGPTCGNTVNQTVLVTGGAGYIGSHTTLQLLSKGYKVVIVDNLSNASLEALNRVKKLSGCTDEDLIVEAPVDLLDLRTLDQVFEKRGPFSGCIHFAGLKAVGESVTMPLHYFKNNIDGTLNLLYLMKKYKCYNLVFSSSATVYGDPDIVPLKEDAPLRATNPYGRSKLMIEDILRDLDISQPNTWNIAILRYFNPIGAHESGEIGEDPQGIPNNLLPFVAQVATGKREKLSVFGTDYATHDGTGVRDYLHVMDLADAHVVAMAKVTQTSNLGAQAYNLGTGKGSSVLDIVKAFEDACGKKIPYELAARRPGDVAIYYADPSRAEHELGWTAKRSIVQACADTWNWVCKNPHGYREISSTNGSRDNEAESERKGLVFSQFPLQ